MQKKVKKVPRMMVKQSLKILVYCRNWSSDSTLLDMAGFLASRWQPFRRFPTESLFLHSSYDRNYCQAETWSDQLSKFSLFLATQLTVFFSCFDSIPVYPKNIRVLNFGNSLKSKRHPRLMLGSTKIRANRIFPNGIVSLIL